MTGRIPILVGVVVAGLLGAGTVSAQSSASFDQREHAFNLGGRPAQGATATSASFRVSLDALGSPAPTATILGFVPAYVPPGEVANVRLGPDTQTLSWDPDPSVGSYAVYRGTLADLSGLQYGACTGTSAVPTATDADVPVSGAGYFYLVTARNRLHEEGTKGLDSALVERANPAPCP
jgi:hypothetical protein